MKKIISFLENFILILIIFAVIQSFFDDYAVIKGFTLSQRYIILIFGFIFDLIFSIEFITRSIIAARRKKFWFYILYKRGWIDFLSSIPLVLFVSGPAVLFSSASGNRVFNLLKVVKSIRVAKVLRLIRILKIFGKIQNTNSKMAQRHIGDISTIGVVSVIIVLIFVNSFNVISLDNLKNERIKYYNEFFHNIHSFADNYDFQMKNFIEDVLQKDNSIIYLEVYSKIFKNRLKNLNFSKIFTKNDYYKIDFYPFSAIINLRDFNIKESQINLVFFFIIIFMILLFVIVYSKIFAQNISDVVYVMMKGMQYDDYNFNVKINDKFSDEEIFILAKLYNEKFLPMKNKENLLGKDKEKKEKSKLSVDDLLNL